MAAVTGPGANGGEVPAWWAERNNKQAAELLRLFRVAEPVQKMGAPPTPHVGGGDHPPPQGLFVGLLFGPFVWPRDSETMLLTDSGTWDHDHEVTEDEAMEARRYADQVFSGGFWVGKSAQAAEAAYMEAVAAKFEVAEICRMGARLLARASSDVERTKRWMFEENKVAHQEVEAFLRSGSGQSIAQIAVILTPHRMMIQAHSADLHRHVANDTLLFTQKFAESPGGGGNPHVKQAGDGTTSSDPSWSDQPAPGPPGPDHAPSPHGGAKSDAAWSDGPGRIPGLGSPSSLPRWSDAAPRPGHSPLTSLMGIGSGSPSLPSLPSGGGGTGFPTSLLSGFGGFPGGAMPAAGGWASPATPPASLPSLGMDFGRGLAAGASAAGAVPSVPQGPMAPLTAVESAPVAAAPAAVPVAAPAPAPAPAPSPGVAAGEGMTSYGSVLPPQAAPSAPPVGSAPAAPSIPAEGSGGGSSAPGPGGGLMPVAGRRDGAPVRRDLAESDVELARLAVAELAGAATVTDPGLDWAVAVGRNRTSGMTTLWVATNDGATYIPPGVYLRKTMPVAAKFDEDFDVRWFGWVNPADKAVRAARACGDDVGAVATTWAYPSDYLAEYPAVREVATGAPPAGLDTPAAELLPSRSHRLQTVDAALYADLKAAGESVVPDYCRELVRRLAFGAAGDELPAVAQLVAQTLVAQRWPKAEEWAALGTEYDNARLLMGAQRPGLNGVEDPDQMISYAKLFAQCRQLEALVCWERYGGDLANVVYAAWVAGVRADLARR